MKPLVLSVALLSVTACGGASAMPTAPSVSSFAGAVGLTITVVRASDHQPIPQATITITGATATPLSLATNVSGQVSVTVPINRLLTVTVSADGYPSVTDHAMYASESINTASSWTFFL